MPVHAIGQYAFPPRDRAERYGANRIIYASWDRHLLFAAPFTLFVAQDMLFGDFVTQVLAPLIAADPDAASINWPAVQWAIGNQPFTPDNGASLAANGIGHKAQLRMATPALHTLCAGG